MSNGAEFGEWYIGVRERTVEADRVSGCVGLLAVKYEMWNDSSLSYDLHMRKRERAKKETKLTFQLLLGHRKFCKFSVIYFKNSPPPPKKKKNISGIANFKTFWFWQTFVRASAALEELQFVQMWVECRCCSPTSFLSLLNKNAATLALSAFQSPLLTASLFHNWIPGLQSYIKLSNISQKKFVKIA